MKKLIIASSSSMAGNVARLIEPGAEYKDSYYAAGSYLVTWSTECAFAAPEKDDRKLSTWRLQDLPIAPRKIPSYMTSAQRVHQDSVQSLTMRPDVEEIILLTIPAREACEDVFAALCGTKKAVRVLCSPFPLTAENIRPALERAGEPAPYEKAAQASYALRSTNWLIGINGTRLYSLLFKEKVQVSRILAAALILVADREKSVCAPQAGARSRLNAVLSRGTHRYDACWCRKGDGAALGPGQIKGLEARLRGAQGIVKEVQIQKSEERSPCPLSLAELQVESFERYGLDPIKTLSTIENLFWARRQVSYPLTDCCRYHRAHASLIETVLNESAEGLVEFDMWDCVVDLADDDLFMDARELDVPPIMPINVQLPTKLSQAEKDVFEIVVRRFVSSFMPPYRKCVQTATVAFGQDVFEVRSIIAAKEGWRSVYRPNGEEIMITPRLYPGEAVSVVQVDAQSRNDSSDRLRIVDLVRKLAARGFRPSPSRSLAATHLVKYGYVQMRDNRIFLTDKGREIAEAFRKMEFADPEVFARWEVMASQVQIGEAAPQEIIDDVHGYLSNVVARARGCAFGQSAGSCPLCGSQIITLKTVCVCNGAKGDGKRCEFVFYRGDMRKWGKFDVQPSEIRALVAGEKVMFRGLRSKGKVFSTYGVLDPPKRGKRTWGVRLVFD